MRQAAAPSSEGGGPAKGAKGGAAAGSSSKKRAAANPRLEYLYGCTACDYAETGCSRCRRAPRVARPKSRWAPDRGIPQTHVPEAPTFYPTAEEFSDPFAYLRSIAPKAAAGGIAMIVPPEGWKPTSRLVDPITKQLRTDFKFPARKQPTHLLCRRFATADGGPPGEEGEGEGDEEGTSKPEEGAGEAGAEATPKAAAEGAPKSSGDKPVAVAAASGGGRMGAAAPAGGRMGAAAGGRMGAAAPSGGRMGAAAPRPPSAEGAGSGDEDAAAGDEESDEGDDQFGYDICNAPFDLQGFKRYAEWAKRCHFGGNPADGAAAGKRGGAAAAARRAAAAAAAAWREPSIDEIEAEFWRIVEVANEQVEALYGQDVDSATYGSGFHTWRDEAAAALDAALPSARAARVPDAGVARAVLSLALPAGADAAAGVKQEEEEEQEGSSEQQEGAAMDVDGGDAPAAGPSKEEEAEQTAAALAAGAEAGRRAAAALSCAYVFGGAEAPGAGAGSGCGECHHCLLRRYAHHPWNVNNVPIGRDSVLRFVREQVNGKPITGVMVPWLYIGSCFSAFCWHIEDHGLYSINYHHMGAPKVWYAVPGAAAAALDRVMADALPHLFQRDPQLLHKLVTMLSPSQLAARGIPVCRAVHRAGSFVITFPDAYHAGFNTGFNVAEAVNFAAPDWLPFGSESVQRYRSQLRPMTFSHDAMLINVLRGAIEAAATGKSVAPIAPAAVAAAAAALAAFEGRAAEGDQGTSGGLSPDVIGMMGEHPTVELEEASPDAGDAAVTTPVKAPAPAGAGGEEGAAAVVASPASVVVQQRHAPHQQRQCVHAMRSAPAAAAPASANGEPCAALRVTERAAAIPPGPLLTSNAAGELAVRLRELRRQLRVAAGDHGVTRARLMVGTAAAADPASGVHVNTQGMECAYCGGDLSLASVVSPAVPGAAVCGEHVSHLVAPTATCRLLLRYPPGRLEGLLAATAAAVPGAAEVITRALTRVSSGSSAGRDQIERFDVKPWPLVTPPTWAVEPAKARRGAALAAAGAAKREGSEAAAGEEEAVAAAAPTRVSARRRAAAEAAAKPAKPPPPAAAEADSSGSGHSDQDRDGTPTRHPKQQQQQEKQQAVKQEAEAANGTDATDSASPQQQQQQKLTGRLYDPQSLSLKLFWDLEDSDYDEIDAWERPAGDASGDDRSSGSWWDDGGGSGYGRRTRRGMLDAGAIDDSSDDDFGQPRRRRRGGRGGGRGRRGAGAKRRAGKSGSAEPPAAKRRAVAAAAEDGGEGHEEVDV